MIAPTFRHKTSFALISLYHTRLESSGEPKVTDLELAIGVYKQIAWFQVSV